LQEHKELSTNSYLTKIMENIVAKIRVSLREGLLDIEGSEEFVSKQIENFKDLVLKIPTMPPRQLTDSPNPQAPPLISVDAPAPSAFLPIYQNAISIDGGTVKILKSIPGTDKANKMVNAAIMYLFCKTLLGENGASFKEIRQLCKDHGCLDGSNFAKKLRAKKEWLIIENEGLVKLTVPGKKQAQILVEQLSTE